jgi:hypothetical protein
LFSNIFFKSRSSNSFTSNMQDFVTPLTFLRDPVMDYTVTPDTLRCNHTTGTIQLTNNTTAGYYTWQTANGTISGASSDSSQLSVTKAGTYIVSSSPAQGCPATRKDTIVIPIDTFPPVSSVAVSLVGGMTSTGYFQLYGGNTTASNYSTPFGGSQGLTWSWTGPHSFTSTIQNPTTTDTAWGTYQLTVTEKRNGCTAVASRTVSPTDFTVLQSEGLSVQGSYADHAIVLQWKDQGAGDASIYQVQKRDANGLFVSIGAVSNNKGASGNGAFDFSDIHPDQGTNVYRIAAIVQQGQNYYSPIVTISGEPGAARSYYLAQGTNQVTLVGNVDQTEKGTVVVYTITGQVMLKKEISFTQGINVVELPVMKSRMVQVAALFVGGRLAFSQKLVF